MCRVTLTLSDEGLGFIPVGFEEVSTKTSTPKAEKPSKKEKPATPTSATEPLPPKAKKATKAVEKGKECENDKVLAERFRTKRCRTFLEKGKCPYVSRCMFAHGDHELRTTKENLRDGLTSEAAIKEFKKNLHMKSRLRQAELRQKKQLQHELEQSQCAISDSHSDVDSIPSSTIIFCSPSQEGEQPSYMHNPYGFRALSLACY